jgi:hypothetical protein
MDTPVAARRVSTANLPASSAQLIKRAALACALIAYLWCVSQLLSASAARDVVRYGPVFVSSDLYVPWLGAKALLAGVSPYTEQFAAQLHRQVYGAVVTPSARDTNLATFQYPPSIALPLLPVLWLPFTLVRWVAVAAITACIAHASLLWLRLVRPIASRSVAIKSVAASLAFFPCIQTVWLQQPSGLVVFLIIAGTALIGYRRFWLAGVLFAIAMVKPQLAALPVAAILGWASLQRDRWALPTAFGLAMLAIFTLSEWLLPGWLAQFLTAMDRYRAANQIFWMPSKLFGSIGGAAFAAAAIVALANRWWRIRLAAFNSPGTLRLFALTCASTVVLMPDVSFYNRALVLPALIFLIEGRSGASLIARATHRVALVCTATPVALMAVAAPLLALGATGALLDALLSSAEASLLMVPLLAAVALATDLRS